MNWDRDRTNPDPHRIGARLGKLERRIERLEELSRIAVFVLMIAVVVVTTIYLQGKP